MNKEEHKSDLGPRIPPVDGINTKNYSYKGPSHPSHTPRSK